MAAIPFPGRGGGHVGQWAGGRCAGAPRLRSGKTRKTAIVVGLTLSALGTLLVVQSNSPTQAVAFISMALFCVHFAGTSAWGLVQVMVSENKVASVAAIQNFGSFVFASFCTGCHRLGGGYHALLQPGLVYRRLRDLCRRAVLFLHRKDRINNR